MAVPNVVPAQADDIPLPEVTPTPDFPAPEATVTQVASPPVHGTTLVLATDGAVVTGRRSGAIVRVRPKGSPTLVDTGIALLEEVSSAGARLIMENPLEPGTPVRYEVPGTSLSGRGRVVFSRAFESPMNVRFAVGVSLDRSPTQATAIDRMLRWRWRSSTQARRGAA